MSTVFPRLLKLIGEGFEDDAYAANGNHLRWMFDPRLGFPREAMCLERRFAVGTKEGDKDLTYGSWALAGGPSSVPRLETVDAAIYRDVGDVQRTARGVALGDDVTVIDFHGGQQSPEEPYACYVACHVAYIDRGGWIHAEGVQGFAPDDDVVSEDRVTAKQQPLPGRMGQLRRHVLVVRADRIDRVHIRGRQAWLEGVRWVQTEHLMKNDGWQPVGCYAICTADKQYRYDNASTIRGRPLSRHVRDILMASVPRGASPLDLPSELPTRGPTLREIAARYERPWTKRLEGWMRTVLQSSESGTRHQSEVTLTGPVDAVGQDAESGVSSDIAASTPTVTIRPYGLLLAASTSFEVAKLLGLATVDRPGAPLTHAGSGVLGPRIAYDYRIRGRWRRRDVAAWVGRLAREYIASQGQTDATAKMLAVYRAAAWLQALTERAGGDQLELWALTLGIVHEERAMFDPPPDLSAVFRERARPGTQRGVAELSWPLRSRDDALLSEQAPFGAVAVRWESHDRTGDPQILNPRDGQLGVHAQLLAVDDDDDGRVEICDKRVVDGVQYVYGVRECDPFGRWSRYRREPFSWLDRTPPPMPTGVEASLTEHMGLLELKVKFLWPFAYPDPTTVSFDISVAREAPMPERVHDRAAWGVCGRLPGSRHGAFKLHGAATGTATHDTMAVRAVRQELLDQPGSLGHNPDLRDYWQYEVTFRDIVVVRDNLDRARLWVAVGANRAGIHSEDVAGVALGEHVTSTPPPSPALSEQPLKATFADAQGKSSFTVRWHGEHDLRYLVYRCNEATLAATARQWPDAPPYSPDATDTERLMVLRQLAADPRARTLFRPVSGMLPKLADDGGLQPHPRDWPVVTAGPRSHTDTLEGGLRRWVLYTVLARRRSGVVSEWPASGDRFAIARVPQHPQPARPTLLRAAWSRHRMAIHCRQSSSTHG